MTGRDARIRSHVSLAELGHGDRVAVWTLRQIVGGTRSCFGRNGDMTCGLGRDFWTIAVAMHEGLARMENGQIGKLHLGQPGSLVLTKDERSLLQALAAAQLGDEGAMHSSLYAITLDWRARSSLALAVMTLAASLAVAGNWLTDAAAPQYLPGAALLVARHHDADMGMVQVAWPRS